MPVDFEKLKQDIIAGEADFHCFNCRYNLRGLQGDTKRCPECGATNPVGDFALSAQEISKQLRRMETAPTLFLVSGSLLILIVAYQAYSMYQYGYIPLASSLSCCSISMIIGLPALLVYSISSMFHQAKKTSIGFVQTVSVLAMGWLVLIIGMGLIYGGFWARVYIDDFFRRNSGDPYGLYLLTMGILFTVAIVITNIFYKIYRKKLDRLLTEAALELLYEKRRRTIQGV